MEENKLEELKIESEEKLEQTAGSGCWFNARFVAPDGHDVGCGTSWYRVQFSDTEFCSKFPGICPVDGNPHDPSGRHYCGNGQYFIACSKCGHFLNKDGTYHSGWGVLAD